MSIEAQGAEKAMNGESLRDVTPGRRVNFARDACSHVELLLDEVRESGLPACFFEYGEHLLYLDDEIYDLRDADRPAAGGARLRPLPRTVLESGVGIEHGWRHAAGCACPWCRARRAAEHTVDREEAVA